MAFWNRRKEQRGASAETETVPVSAENFLAFFGVNSRAGLSPLTIDAALDVPAVWAAVAFLSRTLSALPLNVYRESDAGPVSAPGRLQSVVGKAPAPGWSAEKFWRHFWQQVFTGGRGLIWIERRGGNVEALWPIDPGQASIRWVGARTIYSFGGREYPAEDVIDLPFMLRANGVEHYGPLAKAGGKAAQLAHAMNEYAATFFAGGGIPPLALSGPLPTGADALKRAMGDIHRAIEAAKASDKAIFPMPPGHELKPVGFDPEKGQMTEARRFQVEEVARVYSLPPVFLQDLTHGTFNNTEESGRQVVKFLVGQWAGALESEANLKLFGRFNEGTSVKHNLDDLMRGDLLSRMTALSTAVQNGIATPNEARAADGRPAKPFGDDLMIQGATVPIRTQHQQTNSSGDDGNEPAQTI